MMAEIYKFSNSLHEGLPDGAEILFKAAEIRKYINSLKGVISQNALAVAQAAVNEYSEIELAEQIWQSNKDDWQNKPAFFSELCDAYYLKIKSKVGGVSD